MATPWITLASISTWLLLLQVGQPRQDETPKKQSIQPKATSLQKPSSQTPQPNSNDQNDQQEAPITAKAGKYVLKVTKTDAIDQMKLGRKPSSSNRAANMLLEQLQNGASANSSNNFQRSEQFPGGGGFAS
ncbi:MAG: hypothetical protein KGS49_10875, partial [Planctomycetes bacterium]|nr:hypothetical protein [Planctomycetota bacterium]